jgi:hypothetical protein
MTASTKRNNKGWPGITPQIPKGQLSTGLTLVSASSWKTRLPNAKCSGSDWRLKNPAVEIEASVLFIDGAMADYDLSRKTDVGQQLLACESSTPLRSYWGRPGLACGSVPR